MGDGVQARCRASGRRGGPSWFGIVAEEEDGDEGAVPNLGHATSGGGRGHPG